MRGAGLGPGDIAENKIDKPLVISCFHPRGKEGRSKAKKGRCTLTSLCIRQYANRGARLHVKVLGGGEQEEGDIWQPREQSPVRCSLTPNRFLKFGLPLKIERFHKPLDSWHLLSTEELGIPGRIPRWSLGITAQLKHPHCPRRTLPGHLPTHISPRAFLHGSWAGRTPQGEMITIIIIIKPCGK